MPSTLTTVAMEYSLPVVSDVNFEMMSGVLTASSAWAAPASREPATTSDERSLFIVTSKLYSFYDRQFSASYWHESQDFHAIGSENGNFTCGRDKAIGTVY